ncbi:threonine/serine exporter family protein [Streptacidiphilus cavernicola]|uniref:Threonine/serine exporter ThrE family protein n=1 Tax=Streptacidiphilus cavernicola TaxID=3342716 RepID=A0ABV6VPJ5_9ACTN
MNQGTVGPPDDIGQDDPHQTLVRFLTRLTWLQLTCSGEGAEDIEGSVVDAARQFGGDASVLVVPDGATLTVGSHAQRTTVGVRGFPEIFRMDQLAALKLLLRDVASGGTDVREADRGLLAIIRSPAPYPWWLKLLGIVLFSVGFAPLMQATWYEVGTTAVIACVPAALAVGATRLPRLEKVLPLAASAAVSLFTLEVFARTPADGGPVLLMLPALFYFIPGDYLSAASAELAGGYITTGAIRIVYATFLLVQLYLGVIVGLTVSGLPPKVLFDTTAPADLPTWVIWACWIPFTVGTVLAFAIPMRFLVRLLVLVYVTVGVQALITRLVGELGGTFAAAVVLGVVATLSARRADQPPRVLLLLPGFFALTAGSLGVRGLTALTGGYSTQGYQDLTEMVAVVTAVAIGIFLGTVLTQPTAQRREGTLDLPPG